MTAQSSLSHHSRFLRRVAGLVIGLFLLMPVTGWAQILTPGSSRQEQQVETDVYGRSTPDGMVAGFVAALSDQDYAKASRYLELRRLPAAERTRRGALLAEQLETLLDHGGRLLPRAALSSAPTGDLDDGLAPDLERVGSLANQDSRIDLLARRVDNGSGEIWLIAAETLNALPSLLADDRQTLLDQWLPEPLVRSEFWGAPIGHWLALLGLTLAAYLVAWLAVSVALRIDALWCRRHQREVRSFLWQLASPLRLWLAALVVLLMAPRIGASIVARELYGRVVEGVTWFALAWLAWRLIDVVGGIIIRRLQAHGSAQIIAIAGFAQRLVKVLVFAIGIIAILDTLGYDVTAGLAALGIGGLALALGAQKLVENFVASISVLADRPVTVGEFCKVGDTLGTVEELGIRSTKIRTLDQTLVIIPNSDFAAKQIENFSRRGQFWFHPIINLHYQTAPDRVRVFLERVRALLAACARFQDAPRVRLLGIGNDRLPVEIFGYVATSDYGEFLKVQEELTLEILDLVAELGLSLAAPATTIYAAQPAASEGQHRTARVA